VKPGSPDASLLLRVIAHLEEPEMPPKKPKLEDKAIEVIKQWIAGGCIERPGGEAAKSRDAALAMELKAPSAGDGQPGAMPENLPDLTHPPAPAPGPVTAMAASPRAPLLAVGGQERILFFNTETRQPLGALPFPERTPHVLRFSRSGELLLAAGGRGAHSGKAVLFDVKSGHRVAEAGSEATDSILAADVSPDHKLLACGGPDKLVKIYSAQDGKVRHVIKKHTDWVTAVAFSPDGTKLASADRNGGLHLWDPQTGAIVYTLAEHQARIGSLSWRADSVVLASAGDDGKLILWDTTEGWAARSNTPHTGNKVKLKGLPYKIPGVLCVDFAADGRLVTTGRDNTVRIFASGGSQLLQIDRFTDVPTQAAFGSGGRWLATGDFSGEVKIWSVTEKNREPLETARFLTNG
jgi:WD40 repeat protein